MITKIQNNSCNLRLQAKNNQVQSSKFIAKTSSMGDTISFGAAEISMVKRREREVFAMNKETEKVFEQVKLVFNEKKKVISDKLSDLFPEATEMLQNFIKNCEKEFGLFVKENKQPQEKYTYEFGLKRELQGKDKDKDKGIKLIFDDSHPSIRSGDKDYYPSNSVNLIKDQKIQTVIYPCKDELGDKIFVLGKEIGENEKEINESLQKYLKEFL